MAINVIIFSKNRAMQLDLLLRSIYVNFPTTEHPVILCKVDEMYEASYNMLPKSYELAFPREGASFKESLVRLIKPEEFTMFLCDDNVFIRPFSEFLLEFQKFKADDGIAAMSLRLAPTINHCYAYNSAMTVPNMHKGQWKWRNASGDFGYPMSLDGNIFRTCEIFPLLQRLEYNNPNQLEGALAGNPIQKPRMACFEKPIVTNIPANKVQTENHNRNEESFPPGVLNRMFIEGRRIKLGPLQNLVANSCHVNVKYEFEG